MRRVVTIVGVLSAVLLFTPAAAFAQSATTGSANPIGTTTATVSAIVNPEGDTVDSNATDGGCYFEYGTTTGYGTDVACSSIPSGSNNTTVTAKLTGLTAGQTYDFQVVLVTDSGCILPGICLSSTDTGGGNETVTTGTGTPTSTAPTSSNVTSSGASVAAAVNPQGVTITNCIIQYGPAVTPFGFTGSSPCSGVPTGTNPGSTGITAAISGLSSYTQYYYRVQLTYCDSGSACTTGTVDSGLEDFTTLSVGVATTGNAALITANAATLTGSFENPQGVAITSCYFIYGSGVSQSTQACAQSAASLQGATAGPITVTANLAGLSPSTTVSYGLVVVTANGDAVGGASTFETDAYPSATSELPGSVTYESAILNGVVNPEGVVVNSCEFNLTPLGGNAVSVPCTPAASTLTGTSPIAVTADLTNLPADSQYSYNVELDTALGDFVGTTETFTTPTLPAPIAVTGAASSVGTTTAHLSAAVNANGQAVGACEFEFGIVNLTSATSPGTDVGCTPTPGSGQTTVGVSLKGLAPNTTYYYRVLFSTAVGPVIGATRSFHTATPGSNPEPIVRITRSSISTSGRTAQFYWTHSGGSPTYIACAIAKVTNGKVGSHTFSACSSGKRYTKLGKYTWKFFVRMSNNAGESQATAQFKI
jgi:hypothetical protein